LACLAAIGGAAAVVAATAAEPEPFSLETKIPLGDVRGRIDHLAVDVARQRLFVAELGNNTVAVVDLRTGKPVHVIKDLKEPQGVGYAAATDTVYVANAGDGSVRLYRGDDYAESGRIDLGEDADNIRVDSPANRLYVGYGKGALAVIDLAARARIADIPLKGHPESFQLQADGKTIFVNVPEAREIAVVDRAAGRQVASWPVPGATNFAMTLDDPAGRVLVVVRNVPRLVAYSSENGTAAPGLEVCGDADDVFLDARRHRVYVSCGEGYLDVVDANAGGYRRIAHIGTVPGARTSLFVPELDRLFLAVRAGSAQGAAIWVYRPQP
jgi:DNA-binding beta-propeller fold protein YncE